MNKNDIIKYVAIAGGAYALYWYLTNYGPGGAVSAGSVSWWSTWFGGTVAAPATTTGSGTGSGAPAQTAAQKLAAAQAACVSPNVWNNSTGICAPPAVTPPPTGPTIAGLKAAILQLAGAASTPGATFTIDQWNYYQNIANPPALTGSQFSQVVAAAMAQIPGYVQSSYYMTVDQFLAALQASGVYPGLSGMGLGMVVPTNQGMGNVGNVVPVGSRPSIPTMGLGMSFGNNPFPSAFRNKPN